MTFETFMFKSRIGTQRFQHHRFCMKTLLNDFCVR